MFLEMDVKQGCVVIDGQVHSVPPPVVQLLLTTRAQLLNERKEEVESALNECKFRSGIAHAVLRHAIYRMPKGEERSAAENVLERLGEINDISRRVLNYLNNAENY